MDMLAALLRLCARHGRLILIAGLVAGVALPDLAAALKPFLPEMVALLLFIAALRVGPRQAAGSLRDMRMSLAIIALYQIALPCLLAFTFGVAGFTASLASALVLMAAAPSIAGSPNLTLLAGGDPAPALRLMIIGTAFLPLTVIPAFWLSPILASPGDIAVASVRLMALIAFAAIAAFALRRALLRDPSLPALQAIDGLSALAMAVVVIGLMSAIGPALREQPGELATTLIFAFIANFGLQIVAWLGLKRFSPAADLPAQAIVAGNRNIALFLAALPAATTDPILLFIGCYQIPMYLTPLLLGRLYRRGQAD
ncbi:MAG: hypothetical protein LJE67_02435 [Salaquimonas sp.]|nr:hypothetical protein [Salaquimonas sp.]